MPQLPSWRVQVNETDRESLRELHRLVLATHSEGGIAQTYPPLILPIHGNAFALDRDGFVAGVKLGGAAAITECLRVIASFARLKRLVFFPRQPADIPEELADLRELNLMWLGGDIASIPAVLFQRHPDLQVLVGHSARENRWTSRERAPVVGALSFASPETSILRRLWVTDRAENAVAETQTLERRAAELIELIQERGKGDALHSLLASRIPETGKSGEALDEEHFLRALRAFESAVEDSDSLRGLVIEAESLQEPPIEILTRGREAIEQYFLERNRGAAPLNEVKVLLVGHGSAGKTSLAKRIQGEGFNSKESQTHGINIRQWTHSDSTGRLLTANLWDFGGQEIMHATHQFFLSKRSLYVLVLDGRKEEDPEYWLQHIESFGGDSPIMVVLNKIDEHPAFDVNRRFLQEKYSGIVGFFRLSCANNRGVSQFVHALREQITSAPTLQTHWPRSWFQVKERLRSSGLAHITLQEFQSICEREHVDEASQDVLVDFLHDLGVVLHFRDFKLLDTHVLDPRWVTEAVYRIINSEQLARNHGYLRLSQIASILRKGKAGAFSYPPEKHRFVVDLMLKFELCYEVGTEAILVPDLLNIQQPRIEFDATQSIGFIFKYAYLPRSIMPRIIVRLHRDIQADVRWRTGVLLNDPALRARALVTMDEKEKTLSVVVNGRQKRDYLAVIRRVVTEINDSFEKLQVTELVPLPDAPGVSVEYSELLGYELAGRDEMFIGKLGRAISVQQLLSGIEDEQSRALRAASSTVIVQGNLFQNSQVGVAGDLNATHGTVEMNRPMASSDFKAERVIALCAGIGVVALAAFLLVRNEPIADPNLVVMLRALVSFCVAALGATIPGFLHVRYSRGGFAIRAAGALALFVLAYMFTPSVLPQLVR